MAGAIALLVAYFAGLTDPAVLVALATVLGFVPAAITWAVELFRSSRSTPGVKASGGTGTG